MTRYACIPLAPAPPAGPVVPAGPAGPSPAVPADPYVTPPLNADPYDRFSSRSVGPGVTVTLVDISLSAEEAGVIVGWGHEIADDPPGTAAAGFKDCKWRLLLNGVPHRDYGLVEDQIGQSYLPGPVWVKLRGSVRIQMTVENTSGSATYICFGRLQGWTWRIA